MAFLNLLISLISGIVGGNIAGAAMKEKSLGGLGNSITGLIGGAGGSLILHALGALGGAETIGSVIGNIAGSGIGGAILTIIVILIKNAMKKPQA